MGKTLIIVESPAKAVKIQEYLGKNYVVMASYGHIADLAKGGKHGIGIDIDRNFRPHYVLMDDKYQVLDNLLREAKTADLVLLCGDDDREGTAICWHIKERLDGIQAPMKRACFSEITKKAILKAISEATELDMNIVHAQEARRILDRLVGFMASPFLMNFFGPKLSSGRVQSVVTRLIIDRERDIEKFIPEDFWTIQVKLSNNDQDGFIAKYSGRLTNQTSATAMKAKLELDNYIVSDVIAKEEKKSPQSPLITSSLQRIMSKEHGFGAERTMKAAQTLYESGYCTYIRTDSVRVSDDALKEVREWLKDNSYDVPKKANLYKNKDAAQDAHECIRPSELTLLPGQNYAIIDPDEKLVYETIWKHFVASQMMPAVYNTLKVTAHVKGDKAAEVKASGKALKSEGYLKILGITDGSKIEIPNLAVGDELKLFDKLPVRLEKKQTQPPPRYSEDKLIEELVNRSIGRPSTFATLLSTIGSRNYVEKKGNVYHATDLGKKITDILVKSFSFLDYDFTAKMELSLDEIAAGKLNHIDMLKKFFPKFKSELDAAYVFHGGTLCEKCGSPMSVRTIKTTGQTFSGCSAFPRCFNTKQIENKLETVSAA